MRKSREFRNILDECLERMLVNGETVEQCLQSFPEHATELKPLLEVALVTQRASSVEPHPEFRDRARYQFQSALREMEPERSRPFFRWQPRWAMAIAIIVVLLLAGSGTVFAASGSMPDDFLYPVKLTTEQVQLFFMFSTLGKAELYAELADKRVDEIVRMVDESKLEQIELTAQRLDNCLTEIADLASTKQVAGETLMAPAMEKATTYEEDMATEEALVPPEEEEEIEEEVPEVVTLPPPPPEEEEGAGEETLEEAPTPPPPSVIQEAPLLSERTVKAGEANAEYDRWAKLVASIRRDAIDQPARLRELLKTVSPSARAALLRAIEISENGYEQALESLD
jgi:hypothetical protein